MAVISKSKLIAYRQCPKRLWLEVHRPDLRQDAAASLANFAVGHAVGGLARRIYDPHGRGTFLDIDELGPGGIIRKTQELLPQRRTMFEAGFSIGTRTRGAMAISDVLQPHRDGSWTMVEVKASTSVKDYQKDDAAIQYHIATQAGLMLRAIKVARIDSKWTYPGGDDYAGLLVEEEVTEQAASRDGEVRRWLQDAHRIVASEAPPEKPLGRHCGEPFGCGFEPHCRKEDDARHGVAEHPVRWLPMRGVRAPLRALLEEGAQRSLVELPDEVLNDKQLRVKRAHVSGQAWFDADAARGMLAAHSLPALFLDFETAMFGVPFWSGTRPYQQVPFQFSLHRLSRTGKLTHRGFLDLSGADPSRGIAEALVEACGAKEPVYAYNASFERLRIEELAARFPRMMKGLLAIAERLVDLRPVAEACYYHPGQHGSWSIKSVLPTIAPELAYGQLEDVQDGGAAVEAYNEAIAPGTSHERRAQLREQLWRYCRLDTFAMVRLWSFFAGRDGFAPAVDDAPSEDLGA
jgi:hypothetical protein